MGVLDSPYIKALGVKSAGLKKYFWFFMESSRALEIALKQLFQDNFCSIKVLWNYIEFGNKTSAHGSAPPLI